MIIPVVITVFQDRSYTFITKTPPASMLLKKAAGLAKGSGDAEQEQGGEDHDEAARGDREAEDARPELLRPRRSAKAIVAGTARSMGIEIES